ncbi:helix-turn-helix domain-containing protein [archaeon]|nr:helix-turn-helix domain-containing protein [archaeon]TET26026.1 MAG: TrmB family transcriptional regulator [Candidatus Bathyarchaeum sp.]
MPTPVSEDAKKVLREVGLREYETRAYLTLLERGAMTASEVSEHGGVPYSKVYEILNSLERKGWIEVERGRPSRYFPKAPSESLEAAKLRLEDMVNSWKRVVMGELQPLYEKRELMEKPDIWILRGEFSILAKLREMLDAAHNELMIAVPVFAKGFVDASVSVLAQVRDSGVRVQIMMAEGEHIEKISKVGEARVRDNLFGGGVIVDGKEALLFLGEADTKRSYSGLLVIWSNHIGLVKFAREYFQLLWDTAKPT